ncbi:Dual specificity tyrosine-phosphorylation-regulated kinase 2 [Zancudomyces culisetae]|uniref:Dual specificity tyrosine-phosphorylation-regulated kinase 2 n=1 Tax=Zancudomyces culisetae TaxID=1213189 RepID=A0A1R1PD29_ZANCU|nr:Dual specificity tyrosine-phosphorylation-regulated kinase 2 [Zancudomyces culisetae]|eukprot:OMH78910.1 Dual specificity tyrosine-phosphorylation-regulated kinase 2 [Zancudomyces culisetae]
MIQRAEREIQEDNGNFKSVSSSERLIGRMRPVNKHMILNKKLNESSENVQKRGWGMGGDGFVVTRRDGQDAKDLEREFKGLGIRKFNLSDSDSYNFDRSMGGSLIKPQTSKEVLVNTTLRESLKKIPYMKQEDEADKTREAEEEGEYDDDDEEDEDENEGGIKLKSRLNINIQNRDFESHRNCNSSNQEEQYEYKERKRAESGAYKKIEDVTGGKDLGLRKELKIDIKYKTAKDNVRTNYSSNYNNNNIVIKNGSSSSSHSYANKIGASTVGGSSMPVYNNSVSQNTQSSRGIRPVTSLNSLSSLNTIGSLNNSGISVGRDGVKDAEEELSISELVNRRNNGRAMPVRREMGKERPKVPIATHPRYVNNGKTDGSAKEGEAISGERARWEYANRLSRYEQEEIVQYNRVYCIRRARLRIPPAGGVANGGFDDENGDYIMQRGEVIVYRYEVEEILGKGSFGIVARCLDHRTGERVAVKMVKNRRRYQQQAAIEVKLLVCLRRWNTGPDGSRHTGMLKILDSFMFRNHLCIVTELLSINLYEWLKLTKFRGLPLPVVRSVATQVLRALVLLSTHNIIHCDLKPENILKVSPQPNDCTITIIDFGSSCFVSDRIYTYIQSRFYRAPEVILGLSYGLPIDMWSLGCILYELCCGTPLFSGENERVQVRNFANVLGFPPSYLLNSSPRRAEFASCFVPPHQSHRHSRSSLSHLILSNPNIIASLNSSTSNPLLSSRKHDFLMLFLDFLSKVLVWDPMQRLRPEDALLHPFITTQI